MQVNRRSGRFGGLPLDNLYGPLGCGPSGELGAVPAIAASYHQHIFVDVRYQRHHEVVGFAVVFFGPGAGAVVTPVFDLAHGHPDVLEQVVLDFLAAEAVGGNLRCVLRTQYDYNRSAPSLEAIA